MRIIPTPLNPEDIADQQRNEENTKKTAAERRAVCGLSFNIEHDTCFVWRFPEGSVAG